MPADGWYEWLPVDGKKKLHFLCHEDREPLRLAGNWAERADAGLITHWSVITRVNRPENDGDAALINSA